MKRTVIACLLILVGLIGLFSEVTIYDGEQYRLSHTFFGTKLRILNVEKLLQMSTDVVSDTCSTDSDSLLDLVLSGGIDTLQLRAIAQNKKGSVLYFRGMEDMFTPNMPSGCVLANYEIDKRYPVSWSPGGYSFRFVNSAADISGSLGFYTDRIQEKFKNKYQKYQDWLNNEKKYEHSNYIVSDNAVIYETNDIHLGIKRIEAGVLKDGYYMGINAWIPMRIDTESFISKFSGTQYTSGDPRAQVNPWMYVVWWGSAVMIISGTALLIFPLFQRKKKAPATNP